MATPQEELAALKSALARGVKRVTYEGKSVEYASREEMMAAKRDLEAQINGQSSRKPRVRYAQPY